MDADQLSSMIYVGYWQIKNLFRLTELGREWWLLRLELTLSVLPFRACGVAGRRVTTGELRRGCC